MSSYRFNEPPPRPSFGPLPEGDYNFAVANCDEPYESRAGNNVLPLELTILPDGQKVFANPWSGETKDGDKRDGIAEFLVCINRAPKVGEEPDWKRLIGAKGRCRLKVEVAAQGTLAGKEVNKVAWFHAPKQVGPSAERISFSRAEAEQMRKEAIAKAGGPTEMEPDDIPF